MPILNPDGMQYSWKHLRMWRKNRRPHNCSEMDPIKSYPEHAKGQLISKCPFGVFKSIKKKSQFYKGFLPYSLERG